jgi:hypothetical protein
MFKLKIKNLILLSSLLLFLNSGCNNTTESSEKNLEEVSSKKLKVNANDISQLKYTEFVLSNLSEKSIEDWLKFQELQEEIEILKKGDLSFFKDEKAILQSFFKDLKVEIPESLNTPSILVRLSVLETTVFKLEGISNITNIKSELLLNAIKDVLVANSNVTLQMNKKFEKDSQNIKKPN